MILMTIVSMFYYEQGNKGSKIIKDLDPPAQLSSTGKESCWKRQGHMFGIEFASFEGSDT